MLRKHAEDTASLCVAGSRAGHACAGLEAGTFVASNVATDNFNRANGPLGSNWIASPSFTGLAIVSNAANAASASLMAAYWNPATNTFPNDQVAQVTVVTVTSAFAGPIVRHQAGTSSFYLAFENVSSNQVQIFRSDSGTVTQIGVATVGGLANGDVLSLSVAGTTLTASVNGVAKVTATDATYSSGQPGIAANNGSGDDWSAGPFSGGGSGDFAFTPLAQYYVDPVSGNDGNAGTFASPWKTPNHSVNCGDVLLVKPGTYNTSQLTYTFGTVSNCPSTSGGIDGTGGIYFAVLLCADLLTTCNALSNQSGNPAITTDLNNTNWAIEGFTIPNDSSHRAMISRISIGFPTCSVTGTVHHIAWINNIAYNSEQAIGVNDGGCNHGSNPPAFDYVAAVGNIAQNAAQDSICLGAIDFVGMGASDGATTAIKGYMAGNFAYHNRNSGCNGQYDNEGLLFDTLDAHGANGIWVAENNMSWDNGRYGFHFFWQCSGAFASTAFTVNVINNTLYGNNADAVTAGGLAGDMSFANAVSGCGTNPIPVTINVLKNISMSAYASSPTTGFAHIYAQVFDANSSGTHFNATNGSTGSENIFKGQRSSCDVFNGGNCDSGFNIDWANSTNLQGTNFFTDPLFANTTNLLASWVGAPNCTGFENAAQCMGYDARTSTLTTLTPISNLAASCANCGGKGYQRPSTTCAANSNYPTWLKGIVYLHASGWTNGATITEKAGLVTKPCGL